MDEFSWAIGFGPERWEYGLPGGINFYTPEHIAKEWAKVIHRCEQDLLTPDVK